MDMNEKPVETEPIIESNTSSSPILAAGNGIEKSNKKTPAFVLKLKEFFSVKRNIAIVAVLFVVLIGGAVTAVILLNKEEEIEEIKKADSGKTGTDEKKVTKYYDNLTGELVAYSGTQYNNDGSVKENENGKPVVYTEMQAEQYAVHNNQKRINCVQISNDPGARPQVGLSEAKIIFEAPAEYGATRLMALFRGATSNVIGPVGVLRKYNHELADSYGCTFIFSDTDTRVQNDVKRYAKFSVDNGFMWNNGMNYTFTSAQKMNDFNRDEKIEKSDPKTIARMTPEDSSSELKSIRKAQGDGDASKYTFASNVHVHIGNIPQYNVNYVYDASTNSYLRSYESGEPHLSYTCKNQKKTGAEINPAVDCGQATQVSPKVVVVLKAEPEQTNSKDMYSESIKTIKGGEAWIFQNGIVLHGTWDRNNKTEIVLKDANDKEIKLALGQTIVTFIPKANGFVSF